MSEALRRSSGTGWQISVSRVLPHSPTQTWEYLLGREGVAVWLGPGVTTAVEPGAVYETATGIGGEVREVVAGEAIRLSWCPGDWEHDSEVALELAATGARSTLRIRQDSPLDGGERSAQQDYWSDVLDRIAAGLDER